MAEGVPIPEMIGGALMAALASLILTYVDGVAPMMRLESPMLYVILGVAALAGAAVSYFLARRHVVEVKQRVASDAVRERRAA